MTPEKAIEQRIEKEGNDFMDSPYSGKTPIPEKYTHYFKCGILALAPMAHQMNFVLLSNLAKKKVSEFTHRDIIDMNKIIVNTPLDKRVPPQGFSEETFDYLLKGQLQFQRFVTDFTAHLKQFQEQQMMKEAKMQSLNKGFVSSSTANNLQAVPTT